MAPSLHVSVPPTVTQLCTEDGMEFTLRTDEPFRGRIYTYGYYDRCFIRGSGSSVTNLRITGTRGSPDCGTTKVSIPCCLFSTPVMLTLGSFSRMLSTLEVLRVNKG